MPRKIISITKEELEKAYILEEKSLKDVGLEFSCSAQTILNLLREYDIPSRTNKNHTEKTKARLSELKSGEKNHYYNKKRPEHSANLKGKKPYKMTDEIKRKMSKSALGKVVSEETKKKMSEINKGKIISEETRKKISEANMGHVVTSETRKKIAEKRKGKCVGENHPKWKPPSERKISLALRIRNSKKMQEWRKAIFERDNWTCQQCNVKGGTLNADHIKSFALILRENSINDDAQAMLCEELWDTKNGRTLCLECHKKTDTFAKHI